MFVLMMLAITMIGGIVTNIGNLRIFGGPPSDTKCSLCYLYTTSIMLIVLIGTLATLNILIDDDIK